MLRVLLMFFAVTFTINVIGSVTENDVQFLLYTTNSSAKPVAINESYLPVEENWNFVFIVHGYLENCLVLWYQELRDIFLSKNLTVVEVDWAKRANSIWYTIPASQTKNVGNLLGQLIESMVQQKNVPMKNFHIVGFSLGAHVAGFAGKYLLNSSLQLERITALDAAGPAFEGISGRDKLNANDAKIIVSIHTNRGGYGVPNSLGAVDFFPNSGGPCQPGCIGCKAIIGVGPCSHHRSHELFIDALRHPGSLLGTLCESDLKYNASQCTSNAVLDMGSLTIATSNNGDYYLQTNDIKPYGKSVPSKK